MGAHTVSLFYIREDNKAMNPQSAQTAGSIFHQVVHQCHHCISPLCRILEVFGDKGWNEEEPWERLVDRLST